MKKRNWDKIIHETYELLFKASEPSVDFNDLLANATINEEGEKVIPFLDYEIDEDLEREILANQSIKYKLNVLEDRQFKVTIILGASPKTKYRELIDKQYDENSLKNI